MLNIFYNMNYFLFRIPKEDEAKSMFGAPRVHAESEKVHELFIEKIIGKVFLQIQKICKTCQQLQHLNSFGE